MAEKKRLKTILIGAAIAILAVGLSVGATLFFLSGQGGGNAAEASVETAGQKAAVASPALYFGFDKPFITTVAQGDRSRYMQVYVALLFRDATAEQALEVHRPLLRSRLLALFGGDDFMTLQTEEGRQALKSEALTTVNGVLENEGAPPVERILFTNFVLQ